MSAGNRVRLFFKIFMTGSGTCVVIVVKAASFLFISEKKFNFSNDVLIADAELNLLFSLSDKYISFLESGLQQTFLFVFCIFLFGIKLQVLSERVGVLSRLVE